MNKSTLSQCEIDTIARINDTLLAQLGGWVVPFYSNGIRSLAINGVGNIKSAKVATIDGTPCIAIVGDMMFSSINIGSGGMTRRNDNMVAVLVPNDMRRVIPMRSGRESYLLTRFDHGRDIDRLINRFTTPDSRWDSF